MGAQKKKPSKVPPFMVAALVCDVGTIDPSSGKKSLIGIFTTITSSTVPFQRAMSLYVKVSDAEGYYPLRVEFVHVGSDEVLARAEGSMEVGSRFESADFLLHFPSLSFLSFGKYEFRVHASDMYVGSASLDVIARPQPAGQR